MGFRDSSGASAGEKKERLMVRWRMGTTEVKSQGTQIRTLRLFIFGCFRRWSRLECDGTPKRKNPPEGGFFGGARDFESFLWNLEWWHQESKKLVNN